MILRGRLESGKRKKSPIIAGVSSLIFPGAGQAYNREIVRSLLMIIMAIGLWIWFIILQQEYSEALRQAEELNLVGPIALEYAKAQGVSRMIPLSLYLGLVVFSVYDAYVFAEYIIKSLQPRPDGVDRRERPREDSSSAAQQAVMDK